uniref:DDE Tnp4 domain-containing protein n=1 Tax=Oryza brachyantha TaxID=4533 RepID=J3N0P7_ORYBR
MEKLPQCVFGSEYLRRPTYEDVERLLQVNVSRGFSGMLGSIDCMHWSWEKCPIAWRGQFTRGDYGVPTIIFEAVASHDLRIWHVFFGVAGSNNDINVLNQSPLFLDVLKGEAPKIQFSVNGIEYNTGYYIADGIYPEWTTFVKAIAAAQTEKHKLYAQYQEGVRKDVEDMENFGASLLVLSAMVLGGGEDAQFGRLAACFGTASARKSTYKVIFSNPLVSSKNSCVVTFYC